MGGSEAQEVPRVLYKYRAAGEFTDRIFRDGTVWLSTAEGLNDPFECTMQEIAADWIAEQVRIGREAQLGGFLMEVFRAHRDRRPLGRVSFEGVEKILELFKGPADFDRSYEMMRELTEVVFGGPLSDPEAPFRDVDAQLLEVGIFSLSSDPAQPLLWSHYANESRGIAIGFEAAEGTLLADSEHCLPVNYSDTLPVFEGKGFQAELTMSFDEQLRPRSTSRISFTDPTFRAAVSTKSTHWSYEAEWRYIEPSGGAHPWPGPIAEVVFGLRCSAEDRARYAELAAEHGAPDLRMFQIERVPNTNQMVRVEIPPAGRA